MVGVGRIAGAVEFTGVVVRVTDGLANDGLTATADDCRGSGFCSGVQGLIARRLARPLGLGAAGWLTDDNSGVGTLVSSRRRNCTDRFGSWSINSRPRWYTSARDMTKVRLATGTIVSTATPLPAYTRLTVRQNRSLPRPLDKLCKGILHHAHKRKIGLGKPAQLRWPHFLFTPSRTRQTQRIGQARITLADDTLRVTLEHHRRLARWVGLARSARAALLDMPASARLRDNRLARVVFRALCRSVTPRRTWVSADLLRLVACLMACSALSWPMAEFLTSMSTTREELATGLPARNLFQRAADILHRLVLPARTRLGGEERAWRALFVLVALVGCLGVSASRRVSITRVQTRDGRAASHRRVDNGLAAVTYQLVIARLEAPAACTSVVLLLARVDTA